MLLFSCWLVFIYHINHKHQRCTNANVKYWAASQQQSRAWSKDCSRTATWYLKPQECQTCFHLTARHWFDHCSKSVFSNTQKSPKCGYQSYLPSQYCIWQNSDNCENCHCCIDFSAKTEIQLVGMNVGWKFRWCSWFIFMWLVKSLCSGKVALRHLVCCCVSLTDILYI